MAALTDSTGAVTERFTYDSYGRQSITSAGGVSRTRSAVGWDRSFTGYIADNETGLLHARARQYSPTLGRFIGRDPIGYAGGGYGLYSAYFSPNSVDPSGKYAESPDYPKKEEDCEKRWGPRKYCGPDVTDWLVAEIKKNINEAMVLRNHSAANRWMLFGLNMRPGSIWDHKPTLSRATSADGTCPRKCPRTVTLCGECVNFDVPSNIHYGFIGKVTGFADLSLTVAPGLVQEGGKWPSDDPVDTAAIQLGITFYNMQKGQGINTGDLCAAFKAAAGGLNKAGTDGCRPCAKPMK